MALLAIIGLMFILWFLGKWFMRMGALFDAVGDHIAMRDAHSKRYNILLPKVREKPTIGSEKELKTLREEIDRLTGE